MSLYRFIEAEKVNHAIRLLCRVLEVCRSSFYDWRAGNTWTGGENGRLTPLIRAIHRQSRGTYGSPRVTAELKAQGFDVGRRRVARVMQANGISGKPKRRFRGSTTRSAHALPVAPNMLQRQFEVAAPNAAWVGDITYLSVRAGWVYLAVIIDLFSRKVVGWALQSHMETELVLEALDQAVATRVDVVGTIHHTDRGSQYASGRYRAALQAAGLSQSMSRKGDCWDNAVAESFFGTLEQELVPKAGWESLAAARDAVGDYIHRFYNAERRHSTLGQVSPIDFEHQHQTAGRQVA